MLEKYKETANSLIDNEDINERLLNLIFPILTNGLGYSESTDLMQKQLFGSSQNIYCEYAIVDDHSPTHPTYKLGIKLVKPGEDFDIGRRTLENVLRLNSNCKYGLVTNGIEAEVFENETDKNESIGTKRIAVINFANPSQEAEEIFQMLAKQNQNIKRLNYASETSQVKESNKINKLNNKSNKTGINTDNWDDDDDEDYVPKKKNPNKNEKQQKSSSTKTILGIILAILLALALGLFIYSKFFSNEESDIVQPNPNNQSQNTTNWENAPGNFVPNTSDESLQYIEIQAMIGTKLYTGDELELSLLNTNILEGTIIKFEITCGNYKDYAYAVIDKTGECSVRYQIPEEWYLPDVGIVAYMRFDEEGEYEQPNAVKSKYGNAGEYIITPEGAPLYAIAYTYTTHENAAVVAYINKQNADKAAQLQATREKDFSQVEILVDIKGNIKMVPEGYSLTEANISENRYIYPVIQYEADRGRAFFYIVVGYVGKNWIMFDSTTFTADTYVWGYEVSSNEKKTDLSGHALSEWVYYNDYDTPTLLADMKLLSSSNTCSVKLTGPASKTHTITEEEKSNLKFFLYMYSTYFDNGNSVPDVEWFTPSNESTIDLSYLVMPDEVRARNSSEELEMESTLATIVDKRANGLIVTDTEQSLYNRMTKTYIPIDMNLFKEIFSEIKKSDAYAIYDNDYEHGSNSWIRFYLFYKDTNQGTIETGYIPYITIYSNKTVHIPLLSANNASQYDKTLVETTISPELYSKIITYLKNSTYVYYTTSEDIEQEVEPLPYDGSIDSTIEEENSNENNALEGVGVDPDEFELTGNYFSQIIGSYGD